MDTTTFMTLQRNNLRALAQAQQLFLESCQVMASHHNTLLSTLLADQTELLRAQTRPGDRREKLAEQINLLKKLYEDLTAHTRELSVMASQSSREAADVIHDRITCNLDETARAFASPRQRRTA